MVSERVEGFSTLDWDFPLEDLARRIAAWAHAVQTAPALTVPMFEAAVLSTRRRSDAYRVSASRRGGRPPPTVAPPVT